MPKRNVYEVMIENIEQGEKAWCRGKWCRLEGSEDGPVISRCLVEHLDLAARTTYVTETGKVFWSKSEKKWAQRQRFAEHLFSLLPSRRLVSPEGLVSSLEDARLVVRRLARRAQVGQIYDDVEVVDGVLVYIHRDGISRAWGPAGYLTDWNDDPARSKDHVLALLRQAAETYPNDLV